MMLLAFLLLCTPPAAPCSAAATERLAKPTECGDLLALIGRKPPHLAFDNCRYRPDRQGKPLEATYWVSGARAASVEAYLIRHARLARLRRSCCQWGSPGGSFRHAGRYYGVAMVSDEGIAHTRQDWPRLKRFAVVVVTYTEEI